MGHKLVTFSLLKRKSNQKEKNTLSAGNNKTTSKIRTPGLPLKWNYWLKDFFTKKKSNQKEKNTLSAGNNKTTSKIRTPGLPLKWNYWLKDFFTKKKSNQKEKNILSAGNRNSLILPFAPCGRGKKFLVNVSELRNSGEGSPPKI